MPCPPPQDYSAYYAQQQTGAPQQQAYGGYAQAPAAAAPGAAGYGAAAAPAAAGYGAAAQPVSGYGSYGAPAAAQQQQQQPAQYAAPAQQAPPPQQGYGYGAPQF